MVTVVGIEAPVEPAVVADDVSDSVYPLAGAGYETDAVPMIVVPPGAVGGVKLMSVKVLCVYVNTSPELVAVVATSVVTVTSTAVTLSGAPVEGGTTAVILTVESTL
jgi:hypothetical protein